MVTVQFGGRKLYSGIVCSVHDKSPDIKNVKPVINVLSGTPLINESQLKLWLWISAVLSVQRRRSDESCYAKRNKSQ